MVFPVLSTYRLQLRGAASGFGFTFADAENLLDYLDDLGVSHLYLSPILTPVTGSGHGYDVTDPTTVSPELGGAEGLARLSAAARARGMGLIVDVVPNHVGVDQPMQNPWWWDVLRHGRSSAYATYFDIDWELGDGRVVLPVLGSDDDVADLTVDGDVLRLGDLAFPIAPGTDDGTGPQVHDRQHYQLVGWRRGVVGYRRFFSITSLAGLRQEDKAVFDASHVEVGRWFAEGLVDGVRIDHPDGLFDPAGYLTWLRELAGPEAWIVIEKILAVGEALEPTLPVDGTTGYDSLREVGGLFVDPTGARSTDGAVRVDWHRLFRDTRGAARPQSGRGHRHARQRTGPAVSRHRDRRRRRPSAAPRRPWRRSSVTSTCTASTTRAWPPHCRPRWPKPSLLHHNCDDRCRSWLRPMHAEENPMPDCSSCAARSPRSRSRIACSIATRAWSHSTKSAASRPGLVSARRNSIASAATRAQLWPHAMTTLTTHDTKRGEDVRARIGVLSQVPSLWAEFVARWETKVPSPDRATGLFLWQNIFGVWPVSGEVTDELRDRLHGYAEKSIREAALHTTWNDPDTDFEDGGARLGGRRPRRTGVPHSSPNSSAQLNTHAESDALGQKLLALTAPGIPDVYQGTELWDDSLVDPDNRRAVDYATRREALKSLQHRKIRIVKAALQVRRARPETFLAGSYHPVLAAGVAADHVVAFRRSDDVLVAVTRWTVRLAETGWGDTVVALPGGFVDRCVDRRGVVGIGAGRRLVRRAARRPPGARRCMNSRCGHRNRTRSASTLTARRIR